MIVGKDKALQPGLIQVKDWPLNMNADEDEFIDKFLYGDEGILLVLLLTIPLVEQMLPVKRVAKNSEDCGNIENDNYYCEKEQNGKTEEETSMEAIIQEESLKSENDHIGKSDLNVDEEEDDLEIVLNEPSQRGLTQVSMGPSKAIHNDSLLQNSSGQKISSNLIPQQQSTITVVQGGHTIGSRPAVDINAVGLLDGQPIYDFDLNDNTGFGGIEDRPWRKPGADITDYFNYGFDELTWRQYCAKQKSIREDWSLQKKIQVVGSVGGMFEGGPISLPLSHIPSSVTQGNPAAGIPPPFAFPAGMRPPFPIPPPPGFPMMMRPPQISPQSILSGNPSQINNVNSEQPGSHSHSQQHQRRSPPRRRSRSPNSYKSSRRDRSPSPIPRHQRRR